jgi:MYXO-CTERM domain-containing protein
MAAAASALAMAGEREASACGGCLRPPKEVDTVITDEKMMLSISKDQTTLYDSIKYSGSPSSFAWVLPIKGTVTVGLSASILFQTIDALTATTVIPPATPPCSGSSSGSSSGASSSGGSSSGGPSSSGGVTVLAQQQVGPYETVQLKSPDGSALYKWLHKHGYEVPASDKTVMDAYVAEKFDFLALKLVPGAGIQQMQPVRVTSSGASVSLPLHMVAVGTGATTGITIWVVADGRWEPQNFPIFTIVDSELVWDWNTNSSNYETLRLAKEAKFGGKGWQVESSLEIAQHTLRTDLLDNVMYSCAGSYTVPDAGVGQEAEADADLAVLFAGIATPNARVTRMRSDVAHSALSVDMILKASADQSELSNLHYPTKTIGTAPCGYSGGSGSGSSGSSSGSGSPCDSSSSSGSTGSTSGGSTGGGSSASGAGGSMGTGAAGGRSYTTSSGCSTTGPQESPGKTLAILLGIVGFGFAGIRRRRRGPGSGS